MTNYHVFDRKSDAIVVIGLIPGSGPQSNEGFGGVPAVGVLFRGTDFAWYFCVVVLRLPTLTGGDAPLPALSDALSCGCGGGVENIPPPKLPPLELRFASGSFCGVSNTRIAGLAFAACVLSNGCARTARSASLRRCAACSAFSAAAVVLATCGVTSSGRRRMSRSRREGVLEGLPPSRFNFAMRDDNEETSTLCWRIARLMFRDVRFIVSSDGALRGVSGNIRERPWAKGDTHLMPGFPDLNSYSFFLEACRLSSSFETRSWMDCNTREFVYRRGARRCVNSTHPQVSAKLSL